jgi:hypothetical protein
MKIRSFSVRGLLLTVLTGAALALFCTSNPVNNGGNGGGGDPPADWNPEYSCAEQGWTDVPDRNSPNLGFENAIAVTFNGSAPPSVDNPIENIIRIGGDGGHLEMSVVAASRTPVKIVLNGTAANGSFKFYPNLRIADSVSIYLNGVNITNPEGPAISVPNGGRIAQDTVFLHLVGGCDRRNILVGGERHVAPPNDEQAKGTIFSEARVVFAGSGSLEVRSKTPTDRHAIVVDNNLEIRSGDIIIHESRRDGIHINREFLMTGGTLQIKSEGDAVQVERDYPIRITGGKLTLWTTGVKSHGLASDSNDVFIGGSADIGITALGNGAKGIRSRGNVNISGGAITINTRGATDVSPPDPDDPDTTSNAAGIRTHRAFSMSAGSLAIKSSGANSRGINSVGDVSVSGSAAIDISSASDGIKTDGYFRMSGGSVKARIARGQEIDCGGRTEITGGNLDAVIDNRIDR